MSQTVPHKYAEVLEWVAQGESIQVNLGMGWVKCTDIFVLECIGKDYTTVTAPQPHSFRVTPETMTINGVECPVPCSSRSSYSVFIGTNNTSRAIRFESDEDAEKVFNALYKPFTDYWNEGN